MQSKSPLIVIAVLCFGLVTVFNYVRLSQRADSFMDRIGKEALGRHDRNMGLGPLKPVILNMAQDAGINLYEDDITIRFLDPSDLHASTQGDVVEVAASFDVNWIFLKKHFQKTATREFKNGSPGRTPSDRGFQIGVNVSRPSRGMKSHRDTIDRAKTGQME